MRVRGWPARGWRDNLADGEQRLPGGNNRHAYSHAETTAQLHAYRLPCALAIEAPERRASRRRWTTPQRSLTPTVAASNIRAWGSFRGGKNNATNFDSADRS